MGRVEPRAWMTRDGRRVLIRPMEEADAAAVLDCLASEAGSSPHTVTQPDEVESDEAKQAEWIRSKAAAAHDLALGAFADDGSCVGTLSFHGHRQRRL